MQETSTYRDGRSLRPVTVPQAGEYPPCSHEGCPRKSRRRGPGGHCRKHGGSGHVPVCLVNHCGQPRWGEGELCEMHANACELRGCVRPRLEGESRCGTHIVRVRGKGSCAVDDCPSPRFKARLCYVHSRELAHEIRRCGFPSCDQHVWRADLCKTHAEIGLDFAAGDWFDWVAVEQMFHGRHDKTRRPTALEVLALVRKADRTELQYAELARRLGTEPDKFERWRYHAQRLAATFTTEVAA